MGKRISLALILLLAWGGVSPLQAQEVEASIPGQSQPSLELPQELSRVLRDYETHWSRGEAQADLFVEEGLVVRDGAWIRGRAAIRAAYRNASGSLRLRAVEYGADGEAGYIVGAYGYGDDLPVPDRGMFMLALRRAPSGRWLIVADLDRSMD